VTVYLATDLHDASAEAGEEERLEIVAWPLAELDRAIADCKDSKSLIGMLLFRDLRRS
jgi:ADP-ribose pyrophosphatase